VRRRFGYRRLQITPRREIIVMNHKKAADAGVRPGGNHPRQTRAKNGERQGRTLPLDHINRQLNGQLRKASIFAELMQAMMPIPINDRGTHFGHLSSATS
jgi:hypothetical protein